MASRQPFVEHQSSVACHVGTILHLNKPTGLVLLPQRPKEETGSEKLNCLPEIAVHNVCKLDPNGPLGGFTHVNCGHKYAGNSTLTQVDFFSVSRLLTDADKSVFLKYNTILFSI